MIAQEILLEIAKKKGLANKEHIEKDYFQDLVLFHVFKRTNLLVFKGGTALYKLYNLPRFSEDLDFSVLKECDIELIIKEAISNIQGAEIKEIKRVKNSVNIKLSFKGILTKYNTLRIDINLQNPVIDNFDIKSYIPGYIDINPFSIRVLSLKEITAEKIHSLLSREKARDLYDLFFLLRITKTDRKIIDKKLENFSMKFNYLELKKRIDNLENLWKKELKSFIIGDLPEFKIVRDFVLEEFKKV